MLQEEGLVEIEPNQRTRVAGLDPQELDDIYASRILLETLALSMTMGNFGARRRAGRQAAADRDAARGQDRRLHRLVRRARRVPPADHSAAGEALQRQLPAFADRTIRYIRIYQLSDPNSWQAAGDVEHAQILEALIAERRAGRADRHGPPPGPHRRCGCWPTARPTTCRSPCRTRWRWSTATRRPPSAWPPPADQAGRGDPVLSCCNWTWVETRLTGPSHMSIEPELVRVERPRRPGGVVLDPPHAEGVLVGEALRAEEVQEDRGRLRVAARPHLDLDAVLHQEVPVAEHVVDGVDLEVHVAQPGAVGPEHGELVVHRVDPQQAGRVADPVRDARVEAGAPEPVGLVHVRGVQAQMAELGDPRRPGERDRAGDRLLLADQLEPVAERVVEADELPHPPRPRLGRAPRRTAKPAPFELGLGGGQRVRRRPPGSPRRSPRTAPRPGPGSGAAQSARRCATPMLGRGRQLQADDLGRERHRLVQVAPRPDRT